MTELVHTLKQKYPQTRIDGTENVWVVKPSFSSRGMGVHCVKSIHEALGRGRKMQAKVIQKYIETPFLLQLPGAGSRPENRKFDIRQWVLVSSFSPLIVYMFSSCYLKICGSEFSLADIKDRFRHISNYSLQKTNARVEDVHHDLVMSLAQFIAHLRQVRGLYICDL